MNFLKRFFCAHLNWIKVKIPDGYPSWYEIEWQCIKCGKRILRDENNPPIQYIHPFQSKPWTQPNEHGEKPGDICCLRAAGGVCYEHDERNYRSVSKKAYIRRFKNLLGT